MLSTTFIANAYMFLPFVKCNSAHTRNTIYSFRTSILGYNHWIQQLS